MGINDRDYMRNPEPEPPVPAGTIAFRCLIIAIAIIVGLTFLGRNCQENEVIREASRFPEEMPIVITIPEPRNGPPPPSLRRPVNVNTATFEELNSVPQIGEAVAVSIINHRPYLKLNDLKRVPGIKEKRFELLAPFLTVD